MTNFVKDNLDLFLPRYLSSTTQRGMIEALEQFPHNIHQKFYGTAHLKSSPDVLFQGDCIAALPIVQPNIAPVTAPCILLTNTCDMALENERRGVVGVCYAPIVNLRKYEKSLTSSGIDAGRVESILASIRKQLTTTFFYLPTHHNGLDYDGIVCLDRICSIPQSPHLQERMLEKRKCSLSQYGHYLFLFKLSVHFTRFNEGLDRDNPEPLR